MREPCAKLGRKNLVRTELLHTASIGRPLLRFLMTMPTFKRLWLMVTVSFLERALI